MSRDNTSANEGGPTSKGTAELEVDGACSENPGPAGYGLELTIDGVTITDRGNIGRSTNNIAEYRALIAGLEKARDHDITRLSVRSDSMLIVNQVNGEWDVNKEHLQSLHRQVCSIIDGFDEFNLEWVSREEIDRADELARQARDEEGD